MYNNEEKTTTKPVRRRNEVKEQIVRSIFCNYIIFLPYPAYQPHKEIIKE